MPSFTPEKARDEQVPLNTVRASRGEVTMNRGLIGLIIGVLVIIILVLVILRLT
jgi:preprotein translocase subunit SecD